jgi:hypothetical protein
MHTVFAEFRNSEVGAEVAVVVMMTVVDGAVTPETVIREVQITMIIVEAVEVMT